MAVWMLQPKMYTQIARPNFYNVAYRRTATYKGMGRGMGRGPVTGSYNTFSGQLEYLPPGFSGLGQDTSTGPSTTDLWNLPLIGPYTSSPTATAAALQPAPQPLQTTQTFTQWFQQYGVYVAVGVAVVALLAGGRR